MMLTFAASLEEKINNRTATIAVIGLGYVGLPLVKAASDNGFKVIGFDVDDKKVRSLNAGESYIHHLPAEMFTKALSEKKFHATTDFTEISLTDVMLICVPTPLTKQREPDLTYIEKTAEAMAPHLREGQLVILESTTYPGTTRDVLQPILEKAGLKSGKTLFLAYSPEREDPGNQTYSATVIPKVVGGDGVEALSLAQKFYETFVPRTVPVSSNEVAEAVKLTENIFRAVNIALVNELKVVYAAMGIDVWEVIEAAKTKPFGYMPFYPGPGLGGHCIPIDPFYLTWKAREFEVSTRFIELAGEVNTAMPRYVIGRLQEELNDRFGKALRGSKILVLGMAYKKNVDDIRESPSLKLIELLEHKGAQCDYHDNYIPLIPRTREHPELAGRKSVALTAKTVNAYDAVLISTDHDNVDYALLAKEAKFVLDTRNACARRGALAATIAKA